LQKPSADWLPQIPVWYRHRNVRLVMLAQARALSGPIFLKPADGKDFEARVYTSGAELQDNEWLDPALEVLAASPVVWRDEYRCFVLEREIRTCSVYSRSGVVALDDQDCWSATNEELAQARDFARRVLAEPNVNVPSAFVLDVGTLDDGVWAVVEANPVWSSGIYGCDPDAVLDVLAGSVSR